MQKTTDLAPPGPPRDPSDPATTPREMLEAQHAHIERLQESVRNTLEREHCKECQGGATPALLRESANLTRAAATCSAELRQRDKHEQEMDTALTAAKLGEIWLLWLEDAPKEVRDDLIKRASELGESHLLAH